MSKQIIKLELFTRRINTIAVKTETSRMHPIGPPNAGHIANDDWLVGLFFCNVIGESYEWTVARAEAVS